MPTFSRVKARADMRARGGRVLSERVVGCTSIRVPPAGRPVGLRLPAQRRFAPSCGPVRSTRRRSRGPRVTPRLFDDGPGATNRLPVLRRLVLAPRSAVQAAPAEQRFNRLTPTLCSAPTATSWPHPRHSVLARGTKGMLPCAPLTGEKQDAAVPGPRTIVSARLPATGGRRAGREHATRRDRLRQRSRGAPRLPADRDRPWSHARYRRPGTDLDVQLDPSRPRLDATSSRFPGAARPAAEHLPHLLLVPGGTRVLSTAPDLGARTPPRPRPRPRPDRNLEELFRPHRSPRGGTASLPHLRSFHVEHSSGPLPWIPGSELRPWPRPPLRPQHSKKLFGPCRSPPGGTASLRHRPFVPRGRLARSDPRRRIAEPGIPPPDLNPGATSTSTPNAIDATSTRFAPSAPAATRGTRAPHPRSFHVEHSTLSAPATPALGAPP
jgi:hypothetical protein